MHSRSGDDPLDENQSRQVYEDCEGFLCPSLRSAADYQEWMQRAGLAVSCVQDGTSRVTRTWEICAERVRRSRVRWLARLIDCQTVDFPDRFETILSVYRTGAMKYGCFVAQRQR